MKTQSFKLFAIALVLGLAAIFGTASTASAQRKHRFEVPFAFHVGQEKLAAGKYEMLKIDTNRYWLRNVENKTSSFVNFQLSTVETSETDVDKLIFNRYGETYFLRAVNAEAGSRGRQLIESKLEKQIRRGQRENENRLADKKKKPEQVSVQLSK